MVCLKNVFLLAATASALVIQRTTTTVLNNLKTIDDNTNTLTSSVTGWDGSILSAISMRRTESTPESSIKNAATSAGSEKVASSADSTSIISYINNTLEPDIKKTFTALTTKQSSFTSDGLTSTVQTDLNALKNGMDSSGAALVRVASSDQQTSAKGALAKIDADFEEAVAAFSA
ncbi:MAG: hypothetical protein MMC23_003868 [Stictis urceolatum]|nr:hypothetical protein [Stictis urceolata]